MNEQKQLGEAMAAYALDAINFARDHFKTHLDFSEDSLKEVEKILGRLHDEFPRVSRVGVSSKPLPPGILDKTCGMWGAYVGEMLRKRLGADWVMDAKTIPGKQIPCLMAGDLQIWPEAKVYKRIVNGPEDNVWFYFRAVVEHWAKVTSV